MLTRCRSSRLDVRCLIEECNDPSSSSKGGWVREMCMSASECQGLSLNLASWISRRLVARASLLLFQPGFCSSIFTPNDIQKSIIPSFVTKEMADGWFSWGESV